MRQQEGFNLRLIGSFFLRLGLVFVLVSLVWTFVLRFAPVSGTTLMGVRALNDVQVSREWRSLEEISPQLVRAVIAAEDMKFCQHIGFDFGEIKSAVQDARAGGRLRGASTISQQTAKNVFLWPGRDPVRKVFEIWFTMLEELIWPKSRIMEVYLNIAEWGDGTFGAEAAAQHYYGKPAAELSAYEASLMASVLPSPNKWRADRPGPYVADRAAKIRVRMAIVRRDGRDRCVLK